MSELKPSGPALLENRWATVRYECKIPARPDEVWSIVSDTKNWIDWYKPLSKFESLNEPSTGLGARFVEHEWPWKSTSEVVVWEEGSCIGLSTSTLNLAGLLSKLYRQIEIEPIEQEPAATKATMAGGFGFGLLGWVLIGYTYPQMTGAMYFEYRSALKGLAAIVA